MTTFIITRASDSTYTVHGTDDARDLEIKSAQWPTLAEAEAERDRIERSWKYGTSAVLGRGGVA